jgi:hypothetical protein
MTLREDDSEGEFTFGEPAWVSATGIPSGEQEAREGKTTSDKNVQSLCLTKLICSTFLTVALYQ